MTAIHPLMMLKKLEDVIFSSGIAKRIPKLPFLLALFIVGFVLFLWLDHREDRPVARLLLLHAVTGPLAPLEKPLLDAERLAVDEINQAGGVLGEPIELVIADTASDPEIAAKTLQHHLEDGAISAVIGCWTSACRKAVKPVIEHHKNLLLYPMAYEGLEKSPHIIYTGAAPNQQILPAINWSLEHQGRRFFIIGSEGLWPRAVYDIISDQIRAQGAEIVGEAFLPVDTADFSKAVDAIQLAKPDVVLSTILGASNPFFYQTLKARGIDPSQIPVISFTIGDLEVQQRSISDAKGHYAAWSYLESIERPENKRFLSAFRARFGEQQRVSDHMESAYFSVKLWAIGVERAGSVKAGDVNQAMMGVSYNAPEGIITIDPATRHTWRSFHLGRFSDQGLSRIVWSAEYPLRPYPYPVSRPVADWDQRLLDIQKQLASVPQVLPDGTGANGATP